ncbi:hypothetical protein ACWCSH_40690, partial [Streptosporangium sp. NPDC001682]
MNVTHIPTTPDDSAAALAELRTLQSRPPVLPDDADRTPALPHTGGIPGEWVTAPRHPAGQTAIEAGVTIYVHGGGFEYKNPHLERAMAYRLSRATGRP